MKYVVLNGHPEFRQGLRQNAHGIQHATGSILKHVELNYSI